MKDLFTKKKINEPSSFIEKYASRGVISTYDAYMNDNFYKQFIETDINFKNSSKTANNVPIVTGTTGNTIAASYAGTFSLKETELPKVPTNKPRLIDVQTSPLKNLFPIVLTQYYEPEYYYKNFETNFEKEWNVIRDFNSFKSLILEKFPNKSKEVKIIPVLICFDNSYTESIKWLLTEQKLFPEAIIIFEKRSELLESESDFEKSTIKNDELLVFITTEYAKHNLQSFCRIESTFTFINNYPNYE